MATWADVSAIAAELPETTEGVRVGLPVWRVRKDAFVWVRPLRAKDLAELGDAAPEGEIIGVSTADLLDKQALLDEDPDAFFATSHFDGFPALLVVLDRIPLDRLREVVTDAWLARAPKRVRDAYLAGDESR